MSKRYTLTQYRPNYFSGFEQQTHGFDTAEELLQAPWLKSFAESGKDREFYQFSLSPHTKNQTLLMAEYNEGRVWWVAAMINDFPDVKFHSFLPEWVPHKDERDEL